jgi:hypothetical protein
MSGPSPTETSSRVSVAFEDLVCLLQSDFAFIDRFCDSRLEGGLLSGFELFNADPQFFG